MEITIFKDIKETSQPFYRDADLILDRVRDKRNRCNAGDGSKVG